MSEAETIDRWSGTQISMGSTNLSVTSLGRWVQAGPHRCKDSGGDVQVRADGGCMLCEADAGERCHPPKIA